MAPSLGVEKKRFHYSFALDHDGAAAFEPETVTEQRARRGGDVNASGQRMRFHAARCINSVAPGIVGEFMRTDDAGDDGAAVDADARL